MRCWCEGENVTVYARVGNISEGGLFLCTSTPLAEGSRATLRLGHDNPVETGAVVVWVQQGNGNGGGARPTGMGIRFDGLDAARAEGLRRLLEGEQRSAKNQ